MNIPIFLSVSSPVNEKQEAFLETIKKSLESREFDPRTLGVTDYDVEVPVAGCRRLMLECNGLITVAFRRNKIVSATISRPKDAPMDGKWTTSPFCHIEASMAYQFGLPILIFREKDVIKEGVLEPGVLGQYICEFNLDGEKEEQDFFDSVEYNELIRKWGYNVFSFWERKGRVERY